jgi:hypothetical protein
MFISTAGNVGIGTSSPNVSGYDSNATALTVSGTNRGLLELRGATGANSTQLGAIRFLAGSTSEADIICELDGSGNGFLTFDTNGTERARIDSSGNLLVGTTSVFTGSGIVPKVTITNSAGLGVNGIGSADAGFATRPSADHSYYAGFFLNNAGTGVGNISCTASATAYNTSSDARLKENIADAEDAGAKVDAIQVRQFDWKADGSHQDYGMIAQELLTVAPEAVSGDPESDDMMGVDYSKLVPMMLKEIQSLRARVHALEGK